VGLRTERREKGKRTGPSARVFSGFWKDILGGGLRCAARAEEVDENWSANHDLNGEVR
jgi:hypothetical protein